MPEGGILSPEIASLCRHSLPGISSWRSAEMNHTQKDEEDLCTDHECHLWVLREREKGREVEGGRK